MDLTKYLPLAGGVLSLVDPGGSVDWKTIGALIGGTGGGQAGSRVSQSVQTNNNASSVMANTTNITVSSPGSYTGPASTDPTSTIYPVSQSLPTNQNSTPSSSLPYSSLSGSTYTPSINRAATQTGSGFLSGLANSDLLLIGLGVFMLMTMGGGGKSKAV